MNQVIGFTLFLIAGIMFIKAFSTAERKPINYFISNIDSLHDYILKRIWVAGTLYEVKFLKGDIRDFEKHFIDHHDVASFVANLRTELEIRETIISINMYAA